MKIETLLRPHHHRGLALLFDELCAATHTGDMQLLRAAWDRFEQALDGHMRAEEELLLPVFAEVDPVEAAALETEHDELRDTIAELGMSLDLHCLDPVLAERLVARLRLHAEREDRTLYPWAATHLPRWREAFLLMITHPGQAWAELHRLLDETRVRLHLAGLDARALFETLDAEVRQLQRARIGSHFAALPLLEKLRALALRI